MVCFVVALYFGNFGREKDGHERLDQRRPAFLAADFPFQEFLEQIADIALVFPGQEGRVGRLSDLGVQVEELRSGQELGVIDRRLVLQSLDRRNAPGDVAAVEFVLRCRQTVVARRLAYGSHDKQNQRPPQAPHFDG